MGDTQAEACLAAWRGQRGGLGRLARRFGLADLDPMPEGIRVLIFTDNSRLLARGRGKHMQIWTGGNAARRPIIGEENGFNPQD